MKRILFSGLIATLLLSACNKNDLNENKVWEVSNVNQALVKYLNSYTALTPSLGSPAANGPTVDFYINNKKMNATALGYGTFFPIASGAFAVAPSGPVNIKAVLNRAVGVAGLPSDTLVSGNFLLGANQSHSIMLVDTFPNPTPFSPILMVLPESVSMPAYGKFKVRLLNLVATNEIYELYNSTTATVITSGVVFKNFSDWIELPITTPNSIYQIRLAGTTTVMASTTSITHGNQRSYTFWARGNPSVTGRARTLSSYISQ